MAGVPESDLDVLNLGGGSFLAGGMAVHDAVRGAVLLWGFSSRPTANWMGRCWMGTAWVHADAGKDQQGMMGIG